MKYTKSFTVGFEKDWSGSFFILATDRTIGIKLPYVLYFGLEKCLKEFKITCWTCFEKASLVHFVSFRNF